MKGIFRNLAPSALGLLIGISCMSATLADSLVVPNKFLPGTPARASDVNQNFAAVESSVNDNDTRIAANSDLLSKLGTIRVYDGSGAELGLLVNINDDLCCVSVLTQQGYITLIRLDDGNTMGTAGPGRQIEYQSTDCSGTGLTYSPAGFIETGYELTGLISLFYTPRDAFVLTNVTINSVTGPDGCVTLDQPFQNPTAWPIVPNDPAVTGVSRLSYPLPIKFGAP
jgi:hypothetical protein